MNSIIGIDYSLKSPAVTILTNKKNLKHFAFPRIRTLKEDYILTLRNSDINITEIEQITNVKCLQENERINSNDAETLAKTICKTIETYVDKYSIFAIEGISFASPGNTKIQYAGYHYILRYIISTYFSISYDKIYVYAPMSVKQTAGKGNFNKNQMIEAFMSANYDELKTSKLWNDLNDITKIEYFQTKKAKHFMKPLDDLVDSYWVLRTFMKKDLN